MSKCLEGNKMCGCDVSDIRDKVVKRLKKELLKKNEKILLDITDLEPFITSLVLEERLRCKETVLWYTRFATVKLTDITKDILLEHGGCFSR